MGRVLLLAGLCTGSTATTCDIFARGGTPCVAAHSTVRSLLGSYAGALYQVKRTDGQTLDIKAVGGFADAASQDKFCAGSACVFWKIYDQSGKGNHLTIGPPGGAHRAQDKPANAAADPLTVGGHKVYGLRMDPPSGYRCDNTTGIAVGDEAETMYAVFNGSHYNDRCACQTTAPSPASRYAADVVALTRRVLGLQQVLLRLRKCGDQQPRRRQDYNGSRVFRFGQGWP